MKQILLSDLEVFQKKIINKTGGSSGIRDEKLLESALMNGILTFDGIDLYDDIEMKIAAIVYSLISNHGFIDGNKRIGVSVLILLCKLNGIKLDYTQEELITLGITAAKGEMKKEDIYLWIYNHKDESNKELEDK